MKKTLVICSEYPLPENNGTCIRTMNFVRYFKTLGEVDLAYSNQLSGKDVGSNIFSNEYILKKITPTKNFKLHLLRRVLIGAPLPINEFTKDSRQLLNKKITDNKYDFILVRYVLNASILLEEKIKEKGRVIIDFDDLMSESLYENRFGPFNTLLKRIIFGLNKKLLIRYEKKCLRYGCSLFCSKNDKDKFSIVKNGERAFVIPNICNVGHVSSSITGDQKNNLLFIGSLNYRPNTEGLEWFIETVFPEFVKTYPDAELTIVGHSPTDDLKNICRNNDKIDLVGPVRDLKEYYLKCNAAIVPLFVGGGTRIKILEAIMANRPVLSTPKGAEGLDLIDGDSILLFSNSLEFCSKYNQLISREKYTSITDKAMNFVQNNYSENNFNQMIDHVLLSFAK